MSRGAYFGGGAHLWEVQALLQHHLRKIISKEGNEVIISRQT